MTGDHRLTQLLIQRTFPAPKECFLEMPLHQINIKDDSSKLCFRCMFDTPNRGRCFCWCFRRFCHVVDFLDFRLLCFCLSTANRNWPWNPFGQRSRSLSLTKKDRGLWERDWSPLKIFHTLFSSIFIWWLKSLFRELHLSLSEIVIFWLGWN